MKKYLLIPLLITISTTSFSQNKSLSQIQFEAVNGPIKETPKDDQPKSKYDGYPIAQKKRYEEIDKYNSEFLKKNPEDYVKKNKPKGILADPNFGSITESKRNLNIISNPAYVSSENNIQYKSAFGAMNERKISDLVTGWSGKEGQYFIWNYSKDYSIYSPSSFNNETKLNETIGVDDALQKVFRYIANKELSNPRHLPPKICHDGTTTLIVDTNVDCE